MRPRALRSWTWLPAMNQAQRWKTGRCRLCKFLRGGQLAGPTMLPSAPKRTQHCKSFECGILAVEKAPMPRSKTPMFWTLVDLLGQSQDQLSPLFSPPLSLSLPLLFFSLAVSVPLFLSFFLSLVFFIFSLYFLSFCCRLASDKLLYSPSCLEVQYISKRKGPTLKCYCYWQAPVSLHL